MSVDLSGLYELAGLQPPTPAGGAAAHPVGGHGAAGSPSGDNTGARDEQPERMTRAAASAQPAERAQEAAQTAQEVAQPDQPQPTPPEIDALADTFAATMGALRAAGRPTYTTYRFSRLDVDTGSTWEGVIQARQTAQPRPVTTAPEAAAAGE